MHIEGIQCGRQPGAAVVLDQELLRRRQGVPGGERRLEGVLGEVGRKRLSPACGGPDPIVKGPHQDRKEPRPTRPGITQLLEALDSAYGRLLEKIVRLSLLSPAQTHSHPVQRVKMGLKQLVAGVLRSLTISRVRTLRPSSQCWASFACVVYPLLTRHQSGSFLSRWQDMP